MDELGVPSEPVFIIGSPRSGTSVLSHAIAQHSDFWTSAESDFLHFLFGRGHLYEAWKRTRELHRPTDDGWLNVNHVDYPEFARYVGLGIDQLFISRSGGKRWVDATPTYTLMLDTLGVLFPRAKFIHIVRDGRAVVNSMVNSNFPTHWAKDFNQACKTWTHFVTLARAFMTSNPDRVIEVRQEDLLGNPEMVFRHVFDFLCVEYTDKAVTLVQRGRVNSSYGNQDPLDVRKLKPNEAMPHQPWTAWTRKQADMFRKVAASTMAELGYCRDR